MRTYILLSLLLFGALLRATPMVHRFDFNGTLSDDFAGPDLIPVHTTTSSFNAGNWNWTATSSPGGGLLLRTTMPNANEYSLRMVFKYNNFYSSWTKILSFLGYSNSNDFFSSDSGLYFYQNRLEFYPFISNPNIPFYPDTWYDLIFTRNAAGLIRIYMTQFGQTQQLVLQFTDPGTDAIPSVDNGLNCWGMFYDDTHTTSEWTNGGSVALIEVWSQAEVFDTVQNPVISHTGNQVSLSWDLYPGAISYNVYAVEDPYYGTWELLGNVMGTELDFTTTFERRFFQIKAVLP